MLKDLLETGNCFKLVCGAGNEDAKEVEKLVALYSAAGCRLFDLSAKEEIIAAARNGLKYSGVSDAYLGVSVGLKGDPHIRKAQIDFEKCISCHKCEEICPQKAINYCKVKRLKCIGCGKCAKVCNKGAISFYNETKDLREILPFIISKGIDCLELHAMGLNNDEIFLNWDYINEIYSGLVSVCIGRGRLSDEMLIDRVKKMIANKHPYSVIVQADGYPMSGGEDDFKTTLQAVACAEIVQNAKLPVYIILSGGTNSKTAQLAKQCGVNCNGIAIGSYARKIVKKFIEREDFLENKEVFNSSLEIAKELVNSVRSY